MPQDKLLDLLNKFNRLGAISRQRPMARPLVDDTLDRLIELGDLIRALRTRVICNYLEAPVTRISIQLEDSKPASRRHRQ